MSAAAVSAADAEPSGSDRHASAQRRETTTQSKLVEKAREQSYFDNAAEHRRRHREVLGNAGDEAAHTGARDGEAVAFGRIDAGDETLYIGRHLIRDDKGEVLVVSWKVPAAERYYRASRAEPLGLVRKRTYECEGNTIVDFTDVLFDADAAETPDEFLLRELGRARTGTLRDIVATIQVAQFDIIRQPADQILIIEGGPGTGKTVIALHRVSWLLHHHRELSADGVLVVGPHPTFIRYIREVLPGLGDVGVDLRDFAQLAPAVQHGRAEPDEVARLKGDARMAPLLARALGATIRDPDRVERIPVDGRSISVPGADIAALIAGSRALALPDADRRGAFRDRLLAQVTERAGSLVIRTGALTDLVERLWPRQSPAAFLHGLLGSRRRLGAASAGDLSDAEASLLHRHGNEHVKQEVWSAADLPLLDELEHLINGTARRYAHIVADEAQDLSPMQLRSLARRCKSGGMTIIGDIAQSTGPWARDGWSDVTVHLPSVYPVHTETLRYGYRVPRQAYEFASRLLPVAAPGVRPPDVVRDGPDPTVHRVRADERAGHAVAVAMAHANEGRFVGIVCPTSCRREVEAALAADSVEWSSAERGELGGAINLLRPQEAKGLEFDAVVVVEPEHIVAEHRRGDRMLYVALTRTTGHLDVVCVGEPLPLSVR